MNRKREAVPEHSLPPQEQILTYWGRFTKCPYETVQKAGAVLFLLRLNRILNVNDAQLGSVGSAHHNLYTFHTIYTAQGLH